MTGDNDEPITAVSVVYNIKHVWHVAVDLIADDSSLGSFGCTFSEVKVPPNAEGTKQIEDTSASAYRASSDDKR